ncbi:MAG TPA: hypothetical protein VJ302_17945 [Blastocatellia bacterium]|nr:hypothetical protein [Blastocatellia bacterium]
MGTLIIILISLLAIANGTLSTYPVIKRMSLPARLGAGAVIGLAGLAWVGYLSALLLGLNLVSIGVTVVILAAGLAGLLKLATPARVREELKSLELTRGDLVYYGAWGVLLAWLFARVVMFYPDGMHTAPANNYGDLPFHFSVITSFAVGQNLPPQNPIFAGIGFTYPFLIDFLTAFFLRCTADLRAAFFLENLVLALALVGLIELLTKQLLGDRPGTRLAARLAPVIFLFNGGLGFINFFRDLGNSNQGVLDFLAHLPATYTMNSDLSWFAGKIPLRWSNVFTTLLIPQRSMLFGLPFVAMIVMLWAIAARGLEAEPGTGEDRPEPDAEPSPTVALFAAGVLTGLLPMLHAHGFFAVMIACVPMALSFFSRAWIAFLVPVAALAGPQALWLSRTQVKDKLFGIHWGWEAGESNPLLFWAVNAGIFIVLLIVALSLNRLIESRLQRFYTPFLVWFIVPNVVLLAPWSWDNIKVLVYWSLVSVPLVAVLLASLWARPSALPRTAAAVLLIALTLSGGLDVLRGLSPAENVVLFGRDELEVAELLREKTRPRSVILHAPIHNSVVALSGRQSVMGYPGHLWTHGVNYRERETEVQAIYRGGPAAQEMLSRLNVDYLIIGPVERAQFAVDEKYFADLYPLVIDHLNYHVYRTARNAASGISTLNWTSTR